MAAAPLTLELGDVQGLVARGYGSLSAASFLLLGLEDGAAAPSSSPSRKNDAALSAP